MRALAAFVAGVLFAAGLMVGGMTDPTRVIGFLDVQAWDPTLMFVMGGALMVTTPTFWFARRRVRPVLDAAFYPPAKTRIEPRLVGGAVLFGAGWGLAGLCPGPALVSIPTARADIFAFSAAMVLGLFLIRRLDIARIARLLAVAPSRVDDTPSLTGATLEASPSDG